MFLIEGVLRSENLFTKSCPERTINYGRPHIDHLGGLLAILDFQGGVLLQMVSEGPWRQ